MKTILVSAGVALILALFGTPLAIRLFTRRGYGQLIREEGPAAHATKRGTPTMGGTVIVVATLIGYVVGHELTDDPMSMSGLLVLLLMTGLGAVGFIDDFIKIYKQTSLGLRSGAKLAGQAVVGAVFALEVLRQLIESPRQQRVQIRVRMDLQGDFLSRAALLEFLKPIDLDVNSVDYSRDLTTNSSRIIVDVRLASDALEEPLMRRLESLPGLRRVKVQRPDS